MYSVGKIRKCYNKVCNKEILILFEHQPQDTVYETYYRDHKLSITYFYDHKSDTLSCMDCKYGLYRCIGLTDWYRRCDQYVLRNNPANDSCGCGRSVVCKNRGIKHKKCGHCGTIFCGEWKSRPTRDWCNYRFCAFCYRGCHKCVPMVFLSNIKVRSTSSAWCYLCM